MQNSYSESISGVNIKEATKAGVGGRGEGERILGDEGIS